MVQDKEKLREVGLGPDKPTGHVRAIWALTLILAFVIVILGGIYFILWYSPWNNDASRNSFKSDETRNWQTYENKTYNLSIKYPQNWGYKEYAKNTGEKLDWNVFVSFYSADKSEAVKSAVNSQIIYDVGLVIYQDKKIADDLVSAGGGCEKKDKKIAGLDGQEAKCFSELESKYLINYYVIKDNNTYTLIAPEEKKDTLDKMLSTLNFSSATATPTSTVLSAYSTYAEQARGAFLFAYPKDWKILKTNPYDADAERMELVYENNGIFSSSLIIVEDHRNDFGSTVLLEIVKQLSDAPADQFISDVQLGGKPALKASGMEGMPPQIVYYALNSGYLIIIKGENFEGNNDLTAAQQKNKAAFDHIISSWKWL